MAASVTEPPDHLPERSFRVTVRDGAILLKFMPQHEGNHWKAVSLSIASAHKTFHEAFAVGHDGEPAAAGITRIMGADVYTQKRGYGWGRNLSAQERHHTGAVGPNDLISSPSLPTRLCLRLDTPEKWEKGKSTSADRRRHGHCTRFQDAGDRLRAFLNPLNKMIRKATLDEIARRRMFQSQQSPVRLAKAL